MQLTIHLEQLTFETIIGVLAHERTSKQPVVIDAEIGYKYQGIYIDYAHVATYVEKTLHQKQFETIEEAIIYLSNGLKAQYPQIHRIKLKLKKPNILDNCVPSVEILKNY